MIFLQKETDKKLNCCPKPGCNFSTLSPWVSPVSEGVKPGSVVHAQCQVVGAEGHKTRFNLGSNGRGRLAPLQDRHHSDLQEARQECHSEKRCNEFF